MLEFLKFSHFVGTKLTSNKNARFTQPTFCSGLVFGELLFRGDDFVEFLRGHVRVSKTGLPYHGRFPPPLDNIHIVLPP